MKKKIMLSLLVVSIVFLGSLSVHGDQGKAPLTVAEASDFTATSRYVDVIEFIRRMQEQSPLIRVETMCVSPEGREVPLVIIGDPVPSSPLDLGRDSRAVVYIQGNIHAGEVEGKEASLMLIRDILQQEKPPYLDKLVILFSPIFNADGNERISPDNRRNQGGPEQGVGVRTNGQNLDLNRDSLKAESPELQGLIQNVLLRWDPVILVDCHTTNGSYHEEPVTYSWPLNPNGSMAILTYMRDTMMPALQKHLKDKYNTLGIPYGNFMGREMNGWATFSHQPRFVTNYVGLRNRMAILIENYSHAPFKTRVLGNYHYVKSILDYCYDQQDAIRTLIREADLAAVKRGMGPSEQDTFAVEFEVKPLKDPVTILGYVMEVEEREGARPRMKRTDKTKTYTIPNHADFQPKRSVPYPAAYLIELQVPEVLEKLKLHGIVVERLLQPASLEVESFQVTELKGAERLYQGHRMNTVTGEYKSESKEFGEGTLIIRTAQPLASLASYLLEPESDDGLLVWNYFDRYLVPQWSRSPQTYPVYKLYTPQPLVTETIR
ncbi:MAG: M14 family metallopeptidase [Candidatus Aminicenantaceae bacterium]